MNDFLFEVLLFVVTVCSVIITKTIIPWIKAKIHESEYAEVYEIVETAVKAAEQKCKAPKQGKVKKADVLAYVSQWLESKGIKLTEDDLDRLIEAAVFSMNTGD